jgi:DtxR family Mn-dependent transcriptional regulator
MLSQSIQDYLKVIYKLQENGLVSTTDISKELNVSGASVTGMLKRLANMFLVDYNSYKGVKLTDAGEKIALEIVRYHRLLELYLKEELGYSLDKVHEEACRMEHVISSEFAEKINKILGNPKFDPHGHPIPSITGEIQYSTAKSLTDFPNGSKLIIKNLFDEDPKLLAYLEELNLMPNVALTIVSKEPFNGPITIDVNSTTRILGHEVASCIFVDEA